MVRRGKGEGGGWGKEGERSVSVLVQLQLEPGQKRGICYRKVSVRPSVCLSQFDSSNILVFLTDRRYEILTKSPINTGGVWRFERLLSYWLCDYIGVFDNVDVLLISQSQVRSTSAGNALHSDTQ